MLRFLTAGSVDDGKSTLIGRLLYDTKAVLSDQLAALQRTSAKRGTELDLSLLTDGLTAEREQGITIDIAYRYFATARRKFIIADAPGPRAVHAQHGHGGVDGAARRPAGRRAPRHRHADAPARHARASARHPPPRRRRQQDGPRGLRRGRPTCASSTDFREFAQRTGIDDAGIRYVPMSALGGDMVVERGDRLDWYSGPTLLEILETTPVRHRCDARGLPLSGAIRLAARERHRPRLPRTRRGRIGLRSAIASRCCPPAAPRP